MSQYDLAWWTDDHRDDRHRALISAVDRIIDAQPLQREMDLHHLRMYTARQVYSLHPGEYERGDGSYDPSTLNFNVVAQVCDTLVAKIAKTRPLPQFITSGASYSQQKKARQLGKFVEGIFYETRQYELSPSIVRDAAVFGTGVEKVYRVGAKITHERVFKWELLVEASEGQYGKPPSIYQRKWIDRRQLAARFPDSRNEIMLARLGETDRHDVGYSPLSDQIRVIEGWHLRSGPDEKDGRHVIAIGNVTLLDEAYERDDFPFVVLHAKDPVMNFWGIGKAEELTGLQYEINAICSKIQESYFRTGSYWIVPANSQILSSHIDNNIGTIIRTSGSAPQKYDPEGVGQDTFNYLSFLVPKANEMTGVSQLSSASLKPAGLNSGKAIDAYNDVETERFVLFGKAYEAFHLEIARHDIALAREIAEEDDGYAVRSPSKRAFGRVAWRDVNLEDDDFVMQMTPVSMLSKTYSERIQQVSDLKAEGYITAAQSKLLMEIPDIESWEDLDQAPQRIVQKWLEDMVERGINRSPEPFFDLDFALSYSTRFYCRLLEADDVKEERLQLVRDWISKVRDMLPAKAPPVPAAPPMGPAAPPPMPGPAGPMQ